MMLHPRFSLTKCALIALTLLVCGMGPDSYARSGMQPDALNVIAEEYDRGQVSMDQWALLTVQAIRSPDRLPDRYRSLTLVTGAIDRPLDPTMALREVALAWPELSASTQQAISALLVRRSTVYTHPSPSGFFLLHYDTAEDSVHAVPAEDTDSSGVPDFVEKIAAYMDTSLQRHQEMGYLTPPADNGHGGSDAYDVYFQNMTNYGYTTPDGGGPNPWNDRASYIVLHNSFLIFPPNEDPEGDQYGAAKVTAAHEFHHAVQWSYDYSEAAWFSELDAVFMEEMIFDASNDCYNYLDNFFLYPEKSLMESGYHSYASFIFGLFLAQAFDTTLMRACWEGALYVPEVFDVLSDSLLYNHGWTMDSAVAEFVVWNYFTGLRNDNAHHEEAAGYPMVTIGRTHFNYPVNTTASPSNPAGYGSSYVEFYPGGQLGDLMIIFNGSDSRNWAARLITTHSDSVHQVLSFSPTPGSQLDTLVVEDFAGYQRLTLVGVNIDEYSSSAPFSYSARIIPPHDVEFEVLTPDLSVYSGGSRIYECWIRNPSPVNDVYWLYAYDNRGWLPRDSQLVPLSAGQDSVLHVELNPPIGTPLEDTTAISFEVVSNGNPDVVRTGAARAEVVLYRGDVDFNGAIDISDLVYFVNYSFNSGSAPQPVLGAADHDCSETVDIADLVHLVTWMFQSGPACPCNPY